MDQNREKALIALVGYEQPIESALVILSRAGWDWDAEAPLVVITRKEVLNILERCRDGRLTTDQVTDWADLIECREDIGYSAEDEALLSNIIFRLANPNLNEDITPQLIQKIWYELQ
jgi:hypothetical protein